MDATSALVLAGLGDVSNPLTQLLVAYHDRFPGTGKQHTAASIEKLRTFGYRIFSISQTGHEVGFVLERDA
jgi:hypothetical protein